jgi:hypothetical protein
MDNDTAIWNYEAEGNSRDRIVGLLDGGRHTDNHVECQRRVFRRHEDLPSEIMLADVKEKGYQRPPQNRRT